jgi:hypothetical protein
VMRGVLGSPPQWQILQKSPFRLNVDANDVALLERCCRPSISSVDKSCGPPSVSVDIVRCRPTSFSVDIVRGRLISFSVDIVRGRLISFSVDVKSLFESSTPMLRLFWDVDGDISVLKSIDENDNFWNRS